MNNIRKISLFIMVIFIMLLVNNAMVFAENIVDSTITPITDFGEFQREDLTFLGSDMNDEKLVVLVAKQNSHYLLEYNPKTGELLKKKETNELNYIGLRRSDCEIRKNGSIGVTLWYPSNDNENITKVFDKDFNYVKTEKRDKNIKNINDQANIYASKNLLYTSGVPKKNCSKDNFFTIVSFYDDNTNIYLLSRYYYYDLKVTNNDFYYDYITDNNHKILKARYRSADDFRFRIYDYRNNKMITTTTSDFGDVKEIIDDIGFSDNKYIQISSLNDEYAFFVINTKRGEIPCIWNYKNSNTTKLKVEKYNNTKLKNENKEFIKEIKDKYNINVYVDKKKVAYNDDVTFGVSPYYVNNYLRVMKNYLELFPKGFVDDIKDTALNSKHEINIYLVKDYKAETKSIYQFMNKSKSDVIVKQNIYYVRMYSYLEDFRFLFIEMIDQKINDYYKTQNKSWEKMWNKLKKKDKLTSDDVSSLEDRVIVFFDLDDYTWPNDCTNYVERAELLVNSIRAAFPSVKDGKSVFWEKWIKIAPLDITTEINTNSISVSWKTDDEISGYEVQRKIGNEWKNINVKINNNSFTISKLKPATIYSYRIRSYGYKSNDAYGRDGIRDYRVESDWQYIDCTTAPEVPTIKKVSKSKNSITVKWDKVSKGSGYQIKYTVNGKMVKKYVKGLDTLKYSIKNISKNKNYTIKVRAYRTVKGVKYFSKWSKGKTITT